MSAKSVLRMVFKSLETFLNHFNFLTLMRCKVKLLEILLRPSHINFWLSKTYQLLSLTSQPSVKTAIIGSEEDCDDYITCYLEGT